MPSSTVKPLKIYIDENIPRQLAQAFNVVQTHLNRREGRAIEVLSMKDINEGAADVEWFDALKDEDAVILTYDMRIQRRKHERASYEKNEIGMIFLKQSKNGHSFWDTFQLLVKRWDDIKTICRTETLPFAYRQEGVDKRIVKWTMSA